MRLEELFGRIGVNKIGLEYQGQGDWSIPDRVGVAMKDGSST